MASNASLPDEFGEFDDWFELYYEGPEPLYLGDKFLSDDESTPNKWPIPDISIQPGEYLLFWADNDEEQGDMHTNFKLSASGEFIGIFDSEVSDFALIDGHNFETQQPNIPIGRIPDGTGTFQEVEATPSAMNMLLILATKTNISTTPIIKIYPNPLKSNLNIEIIDDDAPGSWTFRLHSIFGQLLIEQKLHKAENNISLQEFNLASGNYFLELLNDDENLRAMKILVIK